jgi:hypothetical protein
MAQLLAQHIKDFCEDNSLTKPKCIISGSSTDVKKSYHIAIDNIILPTHLHRKAFFNKFIDSIEEQPIARFFDNCVYSKSQPMRMINQSKMSKKVPLKSISKNTPFTSHLITYIKNKKITNIPEEWLEKKKEYVPRDEDDDEDVGYDELRKHLSNISRNETYKDWTIVGQVLLNLTNGDDEGLDMFIDWSRSASNFDYGGCERFWSSNKPNNNYGIGVLINMLDKVEPSLLPRVRLLPKEEIKDEIILKDISVEDKYYWVNFEREYIGRVFDDYETLRGGIMRDLPRVLARITHGKGFYIKKENTDEMCNMVAFQDMKRIIFKYNQTFKNKKGKNETDTMTISLEDIYLDCKLPLYSHYDIIVNKSIKSDAYNGFKGIKARKVDFVDDNKINAFLNHILVVICNRDKECFHFFVSWLRWIMVHPEIKSKVFVFLYSDEGFGKSTLGKFLFEYVFGENASYTCSGLDGITRHFNRHLSGKLFCQVEELPATSETFHTQFDKMKNLITDDRFEMTKKGIDSMNIKNYINFIACSNNKYALKINQKDTRYLVLEITQKMSSEYWSNYYRDFQNQDFADMLYTYFLNTKDEDYVNFHGRPIIPMTDLKKEIIDFSLPTHERFYKDVRDGVYKLSKEMFKEAFTFKDKEYKFATSLQELYNEYLAWGNLNGERDLKRKYLEFKLYNNGGKFRFIDLEEKINNLAELEFKNTRLL